MRCKTCDYPLWNLKARQCPECGSGFVPSQFEFVGNSVKFGCPHCNQTYYGTGERGHLAPPIFDCTTCHTRIHMDEMVLAPAADTTEEQTKVDRMPWLERQQRGMVKAWFAAIGWAMVQPNRLIRAVPENNPVGAAWFYALVTTLAFTLVGVLVPQVVMSFVQAAGTPIRFWGASFGWLVGLVVGAGAFVLLWALSAHGIIRMTGRSHKPLARTCHAIFYSAGAGILAIVPCCGLWLGPIWWIVSASNMLKEAHRIHGGRAACAALTFPVLVTAALPFVWYAWMIWSFMGMAGVGGFGPGATAWTPQNTVLMSLNMQLMQHGTQDPAGAGPMHALEITLFGNPMMMGGAAATNPFCQPGSKTSPTTIPINATTLLSFEAMGRSQQLGEVQQLLNAMPPNIVAHRFGDFVFTYHGADLRTMDANLWTIIMLPDPTTNPAPAAGDVIVIGNGGYGAIETTYGQLPALVQQQNLHRATLGLPPLPDLTTVTHAAPAVASPSSSPASPPP